jgi:tRNA pseudouridine55 synthase
VATRRGATGLCGVLPLDKSPGMTSHDVVTVVRRATGEGRVGHAGTLDPLATGLLVILIGPYTRLEPYLSAETKEYEATIAFGAETDTDDAEGGVTREAPVPLELFEPGVAQSLLDGFRGEMMQQPPAFSAIKVGGRTAHRVARAGGRLELAARPVTVLDARIESADVDSRVWRVRFVVSKGTYVRALARDIGRAAGSAAHLAALRRTASGRLRVEDAHTLDQVATAGPAGLTSLLTDPIAALGLPTVPGPPADVEVGRRFQRGTQVPVTATRVAVTVEGRLAAVYRVDAAELVPDVVFPEACR